MIMKINYGNLLIPIKLYLLISRELQQIADKGHKNQDAKTVLLLTPESTNWSVFRQKIINIPYNSVKIYRIFSKYPLHCCLKCQVFRLLPPCN
jgi:hypothetical protein